MGYCDWGRLETGEHRRYHDEIWGRAVHCDRTHFEHLSYEVMQCGLSWWCVWDKRAVLRACFADFDYAKVALFSDEDVARILATEGMIRAQKKIRAVIQNARCFLALQQEWGSFDRYLWHFVGYKTIVYIGHGKGRIPAQNGLSQRISQDLKRRGFAFTGPVVIYSHLQACGLINDHAPDCPCYREIVSSAPVQFKRVYKEKGVKQY